MTYPHPLHHSDAIAPQLPDDSLSQLVPPYSSSMSGLNAYTNALPFSSLEERRLLPSPLDEDILQNQEIKGKVRYAHVTNKNTINMHALTVCIQKEKKIVP